LRDLKNEVIHGDALEVLKEIPDNSIDLSITSPPYNKKEKYGGWLVDKKSQSALRRRENDPSLTVAN